MKLAPALFLAFAIVMLFSPVSALRINDNLYFTISNDSVKCVDIFLPDDAGVFDLGLFEYVITSTSPWGDLTEQIVRTDENNTVLIPICFFGSEWPECQCSNHTITISVPSLGISKTFRGGVCVSSIEDVDIVDDAGGQTPDQVLNTNMDMFSIGFQMPVQHAAPGETVTYRLFAESQADIVLDIIFENSELSVIPAQAQAELDSSNPFELFDFNVTAPSQAGSYTFTITAAARDCTGNFCTKKARGTLNVGGTPSAGFSVNLFPKNLNVRELTSVRYEFSIQNFGEPENFTITGNIPQNLATDFRETTLFVGSKKIKSIKFSVTPAASSSLYEITISATGSGNNTKHATAYLSTNEMLTDPQRYANSITGSTDNRSIINNVNNAMNSWQNSYSSNTYGADTGQYSSLQETLGIAQSSLKSSQEQPAGICTPGKKQCYGMLLQECRQDGSGWETLETCDYGCDNTLHACIQDSGGQPSAGFDYIWIIVIAVIAAAAIGFIFYRKKSGGLEAELEQEF